MDGRVWEALHVAHAMERSAEFDIVHNQLDWLPLVFGAQWAAPMVTTIHGFSGDAILPAYERSSSAFVSISDADRSPALDYVATVHHGIDMVEFETLGVDGRRPRRLRAHPPRQGHRRRDRDRRTRGASTRDLRDRAGCRVLRGADRAPHRRRQGRVPRIGRARRSGHEVLTSAAVLLHPIHFDEPFGLSVVEAMACGTPVVAYRRGSMPEIIDEGVTGFLVDDVDGAVDRVDRAAALDRTASSAPGPARGSTSSAWSTATSRSTGRSSASPGSRT